MSWLLTAALAIIIALALGYFFPETAKDILRWVNRIRGAVLVIIVLLSAFYFLTTGVWFLIIIGMGILVFGVWQLWFDNPFDFV